MRNLVIEALGLTKHPALQNSRVPKAAFFEQESCDAQDRRLLTAEVDGLTLLAVFNATTTNLASYQDEDHNYEELYLFYVELRSDTHVHHIAELLHAIIPNPLLVVFAYEGKIALSAAEKRLNKNEHGKTIVEGVMTSPWTSLKPTNDQERAFLTSIAITNWSHHDILSFLRDAERLILASNLALIAGQFTSSRKLDVMDATRLLQEHAMCTERINALEREEKNTSHFGERMQIHLTANNERKKLESCRQTIKTLVQSLT